MNQTPITPISADLLEPVPYGFCHCRCGQLAPLAPVNHAARGWIKGEPLRYIHGHRARLPHAGGPRADAFEKFWAKMMPVDGPLPTPCFIWQGGLWPNGYAKASISGRTRLGHRLAYELTNDTLLTTDQVVAHHCDRRDCLNPRHLFVTDAKGNMLDAVTKGRCHRKLLPVQVMEMRALHAAGWSITALARRYGVHESTIRYVVTGRRWKHLAGDWTPVPMARPGRHLVKLTEETVLAIRRLFREGWTKAALGRQFGVTTGNVCYVVTGATWKHIPDEVTSHRWECAHTGEAEHPDRPIMNASIGDRDRSGATLAGRSAVELALLSP